MWGLREKSGLERIKINRDQIGGSQRRGWRGKRGGGHAAGGNLREMSRGANLRHEMINHGNRV